MWSIHDVEKSPHAFIYSKLDYSNALLAYITTESTKKHQLVQDAAARHLT